RRLDVGRRGGGALGGPGAGSALPAVAPRAPGGRPRRGRNPGGDVRAGAPAGLVRRVGRRRRPARRATRAVSTRPRCPRAESTARRGELRGRRVRPDRGGAAARGEWLGARGDRATFGRP